MRITVVVLAIAAAFITPSTAGFSDSSGGSGNLLPSFGSGSVGDFSSGLVLSSQDVGQGEQDPGVVYQTGVGQSVGADLQGPGLSGSGLSGSGLSGSGLSGTGLKGSTISDTSLSGSGLSGTGLSGTGLSGTGLKGKGLAGTGVSGTGGQAVGLQRAPSLDDFGSAFGAGTTEIGLQRGIAQVSIRDQASARAQDQLNKQERHFDNADVGAARVDTQDRRGDLRENAYNKQDSQAQRTSSKDTKSFDENVDKAAESGQKQVDLNDKHATALESVGRYNRKDVADNSGDKALAARRNAFAQQNKGFENVDYGFKKNFDTNFNERGGFKEAVGQDNLNTDVYEEKQRDNRFSKGFLDAFRRSRDNNAFRKNSDWLSNAAQQKDINNQYGAADRLQNAARQQNVDWNAIFDRRNDLFWHRDSAQDQAVRQANDVAEKRADQQKKALAQASGNKGVKDNKYYGGGSFGSGTGTGTGTNHPTISLGTAAAGAKSGTGTGVYGNSLSGPKTGTGIVSTGNAVGTGLRNPGNVKGRQEGSGGDYVNQYQEKARQADLADQKQASLAQSDAKALNDYNRGRGVNDSVEVNGQREGKWLKNSAGLKDARSQGFNGANANLAKNSALADRNQEQRVSSSNLEAANKNLQAQELDRINFKKNQVDSEQKVRKQKKFYHDKNEDGFNNEALRFNRNSGNQESGEEQQAQKEARTSFNNAADDAKVNQQGRAFNNLDARRISNADAFARERDNAAGWKNENRQADASALKNRAAFEAGRQNSEFDNFARNVNNRNQRLWDKARKDLAQRSRGQDKDRAVDAAFLFSPQSGDNVLGLGRQQTPFRGSQGTGVAVGLDSKQNTPTRFGSGLGSRSSFGSGFNTPVGGFMDEIGSSKFGQFGFGGAPAGSTAFGGSGGNLYSNSNTRRK